MSHICENLIGAKMYLKWGQENFAILTCGIFVRNVSPICVEFARNFHTFDEFVCEEITVQYTSLGNFYDTKGNIS